MVRRNEGTNMYAEDTTVPVTKTVEEIDRLLASKGARSFATGSDREAGTAYVACRVNDRALLFRLQLPMPSDFAMKPSRATWRPPTPRKRAEVDKLFERACRSRWRALLLAIKSKFVAIESGVETFDEAFLAALMVRDESGVSRRMGDLAVRLIEASQAKGPPALPAGVA